jgi:hypothetical protein
MTTLLKGEEGLLCPPNVVPHPECCPVIRSSPRFFPLAEEFCAQLSLRTGEDARRSIEQFRIGG